MAAVEFKLHPTIFDTKFISFMIMFQPDILQPSWSYSDNMTSQLQEGREYDFGLIADMDSPKFSSMYNTLEASNDTSFSFPYLANIFTDQYVDSQSHIEQDSQSHILKATGYVDLEELDPMLIGEMEGMPLYFEDVLQESSFDGEDEWSLSQPMNTSHISMDISSSEISLIQPSLTLPIEGMGIGNQLAVIHLIVAYKEAMENENIDLADVIVKQICQSVNPVGEIMERLLYYIFGYEERQSDCLKAESNKNFYAAYKAFYQMLPYGKFAHFAANAAILKAIANNVVVIHIVDFDIGDGIQWCTMIAASGYQLKELRLTCIKWIEGDSSCNPSKWKFDETKKRLLDHARSFNITLIMEEIELQDLCHEMKKMGDHKEQLYAFNCMVSLPHMGMERSRKDVFEFLRVAKDFVTYTNNSRGIITFGDGDDWDKLKFFTSFNPFFEAKFVHYQSFLESLECNFLIQLKEARTAMEFLFIAPFVSSQGWFEKWKEMKECYDIQSADNTLKGCNISTESLMEAKEMVKEGESLYQVRTEGENNNQLVLDWRGNKLLSMSCWHN